MKMNELTKRILSIIFILPVTIYFVLKGFFLFNIFLIFFCVLALREWQKISKNNIFCFPGIFFILFSFYTVSNIRNSDFNFGLNNFLFIFFICVSSDVGGYVFGKLFKGPKLTRISPNKTYAGVFGGFILAIMASVFMLTNNLNPKMDNFLTSSNALILIFSFFLSAINQIGDLVISYFKRISGFKDTGNVIPGHGGILDRIDGMIFTFPIFYLINLF